MKWTVRRRGDKLRLVGEAQMENDEVTPGAPLRQAIFSGKTAEEVRAKIAQHDVWDHFDVDEGFKMGVALTRLERGGSA